MVVLNMEGQTFKKNFYWINIGLDLNWSQYYGLKCVIVNLKVNQ